MDNEALERVINKLASVVPEKLTEEQIKNITSDKVPKAFYYEMLIDLLTQEDSREDKVILTEARLLVKLINYKKEKEPKLTPPKTRL